MPETRPAADAADDDPQPPPALALAPPASAADEAPSEDVIVDGVNLTRDFQCAGCGNCCRGPGTVWVDRRGEIAIAEHLGIGLGEFRERYCDYPWQGGHILRNRSVEDDACVFLDEFNRCLVHAVKPRQCAEFPFKWRNPDFADTCEGFRQSKRRASGESSERP